MNPELKKWCERAEKLQVYGGKEYFKLHTGQKYSKEKIHAFEKESLKQCLEFLKKFKKPKELHSMCVGGVAGSKTYKLYLQLHDLRAKAICSKKYKICWPNWRTFAVNAEDSARKEVFDEFIKKAPAIAPVIKKNFDESKKIYAQYGLEPLTEHLEDHKITLKTLKSTIIKLREGVKKSYWKEFNEYSQKILGREPRYYDDLYFMRNKVFEELVPGFKGVNPLAKVNKALREMGLNPSKIQIDRTPRPKKDSSPFCMWIKIPDNVWISYKEENPLNTANSIYHEYGHAIHASSIDPKLPYWKKYGTSHGLNETFSIFLECLMLNKKYLLNELKLPEDYADEFIKRTYFVQKLTTAFYTANSLFKIKYWEKELPFGQCDKEYMKEIKKSMNLKIPGAYWKLHHILPEHMIYVPSYLLAYINSSEMHNELEEKYGEKWYKNKKSGKYLFNLMRPGIGSARADFSKPKPKAYLRRLGC